jgi:excisionase family DNA binding protein
MNNPFELIDARLSNIENLLLDLKKLPTPGHPEPDPDRWFNLDELCLYLPDKPAKPTVYGWVHSGTIPNHKSGKKLRFLKSETDLWLKTGRRKTIAETAEEANQYIIGKRLHNRK